MKNLFKTTVFTILFVFSNNIFSQITITIDNYNNCSCYGDATGQIDISVSGGLAPYTYNWENSINSGVTISTNEDLTNLSAGTYCVTVTDNNSDTQTQCITITEPNELIITIDTIEPAHCGLEDGSASVIVSGGSPLYTYQWLDASSTVISNTEQITSVFAGTYTFIVTDASACTATETITILDNPPPSIDSAIVDNVCYGESDGSISVYVSGGVSPYSYSWNTTPAQFSQTATGLIAGIYQVVVTDATGCINSAEIEITENPEILISISNVNVSCFGMADGSATINANGGTSPYTYSWNTTPTQLTQTATGLVAETYQGVVTDANSCSTSQTITITEPDSLYIIATDINGICPGMCNGSIATEIIGGAGFGYEYSWNTGQTTGYITGLCEGWYVVSVQDINFCTAVDSFYVPETGLTITPTIINNICAGDSSASITVNVDNGTPPYDYTWSYSYSNVQTITNLPAGNYYSVTVVDTYDCGTNGFYSISDPDSIHISLDSIINVTNGVCNGLIDVSITNAVLPFNISWSNGETTNLIDNLCPETYNLLVTDSNGCTAEASYEIGSSYDTSYTFVDTIYSTIDSCIFSNTLPVDSALIYAYETITPDSIVLNWIFWQDGNSILLDMGVHLETQGSNLIYLEIICGTKATYIYSFYGTFNAITTGIQKMNVVSANIFPNPSNGFISVEAKEMEQIEIINISGNIVKSINVNNSDIQNIDISNQAKGIYFVKVITTNGSISKKIIIE